MEICGESGMPNSVRFAAEAIALAQYERGGDADVERQYVERVDDEDAADSERPVGAFRTPRPRPRPSRQPCGGP
jgi:hypothetical protein